mmetsp:Transcript_31427/g.73397  ORF Transcript_31427/g.73397 Transcript_31427/m.73397 type:complete len:381 (+) Transcript_31427:141-1283(+)
MPYFRQGVEVLKALCRDFRCMSRIESQGNSLRKPLGVVILCLPRSLCQVEIKVAWEGNIKLAPLLRCTFAPQSNVKYILIFHPALFGKPLRRLGAMRCYSTESPLCHEGDGMECECGMRMAPAHRGLWRPSRIFEVKSIILVSIKRLGISTGPMHGHDRIWIVGSNLLSSSCKHAVEARVEELIRVNDNPSADHCEDSRPQLVEIEKHRIPARSRMHEQQVRVGFRSPRLRNELPKVDKNNRPRREAMHGLQQQIHLCANMRLITFDCNVADIGLLDPTIVVAECEVVGTESAVGIELHKLSIAKFAERFDSILEYAGLIAPFRLWLTVAGYQGNIRPRHHLSSVLKMRQLNWQRLLVISVWPRNRLDTFLLRGGRLLLL